MASPLRTVRPRDVSEAGASQAPAERRERVKRGTILLATASALVLAAVASLAASIGVASAGTQRTAASAATAAAFPAPRVPNAAQIKARYGGQSITFIGDSVGGSHNRDLALAKRFTQDTGIKV
jgi:hypothetical protein